MLTHPGTKNRIAITKPQAEGQGGGGVEYCCRSPVGRRKHLVGAVIIDGCSCSWKYGSEGENEEKLVLTSSALSVPAIDLA